MAKKKFLTRRRKIIFIGVIVVLIICASVFYLYFSRFSQETQFDAVVNGMLKENPDTNPYYIKENFSSYDAYSLSLDSIEGTQGFMIFGNAKDLGTSDGGYGTEKSISFLITKSKRGNDYVTVKKILDSTQNISRWNQNGYLSMWINIEDRMGISGVSIRLIDVNGNFRDYDELPNLQITDPDIVKVNDLYPDIAFPGNATPSNKWQDFRLVPGWNFLFWRMDTGHFKEYGKFDINRIASYDIIINLTSDFSEQTIKLDNLRVEDGLQGTKNPTNGNWYPPNDAPMYGIFDIDKFGGVSFMRMLNVRQTQYPSNGDHTRVLSNISTPKNFIMQIYFTLRDLPDKYQGSVFNHTANRKNTWFRVEYDFDNVYDPGHDWFGFFMSMETDSIGLVTTYPITRYFKQGQEPVTFDSNSRKHFTPETNVTYVLDLQVVGQNEKATIYKLNGEVFEKMVEVEYTFNRQRYDDKRYPISIEATGNVHADIYSVEVVKL